MRHMEKEAGCIFPRWMTTASYLEACRVSAFFNVKKVERVDVAPHVAAPRLTVVAS
jgi:hypothetical protein